MRACAKWLIILGQVKTAARVPGYLEKPTVSTSYLELLLEILREHGVSGDQFFAGLQLPRQLVEAPRMSPVQWAKLVHRAQRLLGAQGASLGFEYGLRMRPTVHGLVGFAAVSAPSVRAAIEIVLRYARVRLTHFELSLDEQPMHCQLVLKERFPIPVLRAFFVESILVGLARGCAVLVGRDLAELSDYEFCFDTPEPAYAAAWRSRVGAMRFHAPVNAIRFSHRYLELRPVLADPHASEQARALCEDELALAQHGDRDFVARVVAELKPLRDQTGYPPVEAVAHQLACSARTLKRRLQQDGTSYVELLTAVRTNDACQLLARTDLSIQTIAGRLGYRNPANFTRAFSRATGKTPSAYRAEAVARS